MGSAQSGNTRASMFGKKNGSNCTLPSDSYYECRNAAHAGSWYTDDREQLISTLRRFLSQVETTKQQSQTSFYSSTNNPPNSILRALICPHAGYSYSGPTAAYSYSALLEELIRPHLHPSIDSRCDCRIRQIVILHPSHHVPLRGKCAVSGAQIIATPLGNLQVDTALRNEILRLLSVDKKHSFSVMTQEQDENEHSGEMQYPYIAHIIQQAEAILMAKQTNSTLQQITVTPIMCGSLSTADEIAYGTLLSEILDRPSVLSIVSTDFCHWGRRFGYQPTTTTTNHVQQLSSTSGTSVTIPIYKMIEQLDRRGMDLIEAKEPGAFASYLRETNNTICGRHAVSVWLRSITTRTQNADVEQLADNPKLSNEAMNESIQSTNTFASSLLNHCTIRFIHYEQSSQSRTLSDSSVSYAAGIATIELSAIQANRQESLSSSKK